MALEIVPVSPMLYNIAMLLCGTISSAFSTTTKLYNWYIFILMSIKASSKTRLEGSLSNWAGVANLGSGQKLQYGVWALT